MKRCTAAVPRVLCTSNRAHSGRRWTSYSSSSLTEEALLEKVGAKLNDGTYGENIKVDSKKKTITTSSGELPLSPLFDPAWIKSRRRQEKAPASLVTSQFRRLLLTNPFANALATPLRYCPITKTHLPRYFLQEFDLVKHPDTDEGWFAPGNEGFKHVQTNNHVRANGTPTEAGPAKRAAAAWQDEPSPRLKCYAVSQKSIIDAVGSDKKKTRGSLFARRYGMAMNSEAKMPVWRYDMSEVVLQTMRREAVGALIQRASVAKSRFVQPCSRWEDIKDVDSRGCILWLPQNRDGAAARQYATYDIEGVKYGGKMAVHDLFWLFGDEEVARLRAGSTAFRENDLLVLKTWKSKSMKQLHMLLWRLQGFLDIPC